KGCGDKQIGRRNDHTGRPPPYVRYSDSDEVSVARTCSAPGWGASATPQATGTTGLVTVALAWAGVKLYGKYTVATILVEKLPGPLLQEVAAFTFTYVVFVGDFGAPDHAGPP